ncbi:MAG: right-handed parallel beta-helix repeat-containing protein [Bdellovibrionia bacterium]
MRALDTFLKTSVVASSVCAAFSVTAMAANLINPLPDRRIYLSPTSNLTTPLVVNSGTPFGLDCGTTYMGTIKTIGTTDVTIQSNGTCATGMDPVIIPAAPVPNSWSLYQGNIYVANVSYQVAQVFANSQLLDLAHFPEEASEVKWLQPTSVATYSSTADSIVHLPSLPSTDLIGAQMTYRGRYPWVIGTRTITNYSSATATATLGVQSDVDLRAEDAPDVQRFYLEGKLWMLTNTKSPGWAFISNGAGGKLYVRMPDGQSPGTRLMAAFDTRRVIDARGATNLTLNHVRVVGGYIGVDGGYLDSMATASNGLKVLYSEVSYSSFAAIYASNATGLTVNRSSILGALHSGIYARVGSSGTKVTYSNFSNVNNVGMHRGGIAAIFLNKDVSPQVAYNNVYYSGKTAIWVGSSSHAAVNGNVVDGACINHGDCGGIYLISSPPGSAHPELNSSVTGNLVQNVTGEIVRIGGTAPERYGIYLDDYSNKVLVQGNIIQKSDTGMQIHLGYNNNISNNKFTGNQRWDILLSDSGNVQGDLMHDNLIHANNMFLGATQAFYFAFGGQSKPPVSGVATPAAVFNSSDRNTYDSITPISNISNLIYY